MASNTTLNTGAGGDIIATKERTHDGDAAKVQVVTLAGVTGSEGSYTFTDIQAGGGTEAGAVRVTIASDSTGVVSVDDNGGSLTVDGTVELGATSLAALESLTTISTVTTVGAVTGITNALPAGTNNIGDVDVLSVVPGTGATALGKAEDAAHASGDTGVMALAVRRDADTTLADTTGDYAPLQVNASGSLKVAITSGAGSGGTSIADGASFTRDTTSITPAGAVVESSAPTLTNGDVAGLSMTTGGALRVAMASGGVAGQVDDAAFTAGTTEGVAVMGYYSSTRDSIDSGDAGAVALNARRAQYVTADGLVSTANSTTANLAGAAAFTGTAEDVTDYALIQVSVFSSHASGTDGLSLQQSSNGTNWDITDTFTVSATTPKVISIQPAAQYFRLVYTNGATLTTSLRIQTVFKVFASKGSSQRPADATSNENDFEMSSAFLHGFNGTTWDRLRSDTTNGLDVDVVRLPTLANVTTLATLTNITNWGNVVDDAAFTPATTRVLMAGFQADETATDSVDEGDGGAARMTLDRKQIVTSYAHAAGGATPGRLVSAASTNGTVVKASAGTLYALVVMNLNAAVRYLKVYNSASVTVGTTTPTWTFPIPASTTGAGFNVPIPACGIAFGTGICLGLTTGVADNDTGAVAANEILVNYAYI